MALENVKAVLCDVPGSDVSDAEWISGQLKELGYGTVVMTMLDATMYGSPAARDRVYWLACLGEDAGHLGCRVGRPYCFTDPSCDPRLPGQTSE